MTQRNLPIEERFFLKVSVRDVDECWPWIGAKDAGGYGLFNLNGKTVRAHRFAWERKNGPIPKGAGYHGNCVCHRCDTPACCNERHLFLGTNAENMADRNSKGRQAHVHGESCGASKLTEPVVLEIRRSTLSGIELSQKFGISRTNVSAIKTGRIWKYLIETPARVES